MEFEIPESLELEHEELHRQLVDAMKEGGKVGEAAKAVANVLHPHFEKEEEYALPPLGLLSTLAKQTQISPEMKSILTMTDRLKADLPHMIEANRFYVDDYIIDNRFYAEISFGVVAVSCWSPEDGDGNDRHRKSSKILF